MYKKNNDDNMGRRQTMMEKFKQQMKAYRKKRMQHNSTPYLPHNGTVYVMDSLEATKQMIEDSGFIIE